jgi:hypothetical protein
VEIVRSDGRRELYDSLVFANVTRIANYGRLSFGLDGGLSEVVSCRILDDQRCSLPDRRELLHLKPNSKITINWPHTATPRSAEPAT